MSIFFSKLFGNKSRTQGGGHVNRSAPFTARVGQGMTPSQTRTAYSTLSRPTMKAPNILARNFGAGGFGNTGINRTPSSNMRSTPQFRTGQGSHRDRLRQSQDSLVPQFRTGQGNHRDRLIGGDDNNSTPMPNSNTMFGPFQPGQRLPADIQAQVNALSNQKVTNERNAYDTTGGAFSSYSNTQENGNYDFNIPETEASQVENQGYQDNNDYQSQLDAIQAQIEKLSKQPYASEAELNALLQEEVNIKENLGKSLEGIAGQAIPYQFITGQGARIQDLANIDLERVAGQQQTTQQKLAQEQARRQSAIDILRDKLQGVQRTGERNQDRSYQEFVRQQNMNFDKQKFNEDVRQFGLEFALKKQQERRIGSNQAGKTTTMYTSKNIPRDVRGDLIADMGNRRIKLQQLYSAYPDVDTEYINALWEQVRG